MSRRLRRGLRGVLITVMAGLVLVLLTGCGAPDDEVKRPTRTTTLAPELPPNLPTLPTGHGDVAPGDPVRAHGTTLVVKGHPVRLAPLRADAVAVVPGGVYFLNGTELWFTDLDQASATGYDDVTGLKASADGRWVGFIDRGHGPLDDHGTRLALVLAYDARTGKVQKATYDGMGDPATDDLAARYAKSPPAVVGFDGEVMLVRGVDGLERVPLTGDGSTRSS